MVDSKLFMASLDVESLFTNIPLEETITIAVDTLFKDKETVNKLTKDEFKTLLDLATKESWFLFGDTYYNQIDGVAMGNPLGPTMANLFMCHFEKLWLHDCPPSFKPSFYRRYVDDIFVLFEGREQFIEFKNYLNSRHANIRFTEEVEKDDRLPFLDVEIFREDGHLHTTVYRKSSFTGLYSNFKSLLPQQYKKGLILSLLFRLYSICSNWALFHAAADQLKCIMVQNGYPTFLFDKCISIFLNKRHTMVDNNNTTDNNDNILTLVLPFMGNHSLKTRTQILKIARQCIPNCKIRVIFKISSRISNYFKFKDPISKDLQSHVVYKVSCKGCNLFYYGFSDRHLKVRAYDHLGLSYLKKKPIKGVDTSMKTHCRENDHVATWDDVSIVGRDECSWRLRIKESLTIKRDQPLLNKMVYSTPLLLF